MELFNYLLKVSACSALFFAFYLLVLRKLTFFKINRFYLLFSVFISFIIPALQFTIEREVVERIETVNPVASPDVALGSTGFESPIAISTVPAEAPFNWFAFVPYLYGGIVACLLLLAAWRLFQLLKHTKTPVKEINGLKLFAKKDGFTNCSFFNYVFIDENSLTQDELAVLLSHEEVHARAYHSVDKLLMMVAKAVLWFNPVIYLYDKALEQTHEYEADEATSQNVGTELYATLLLKLAVSKNPNPLIHNFVKSPIKQRIKMLFNSKSKNMKKLAYLLALPIGLGLIWGFTVKINTRVMPLVQQETPKLQDTLMGKIVKGKVISFEKTMMGQVLNLKVGNKIVPISCYNFKDKVKIGDEISIIANGKSFLPPPVISTTRTDAKGNKSVSAENAPYMVSKVIGANGKMIYELPHYAFLYEANRARFAGSTIKSIEKSANGTINKIVLYDKNGFTINLNVAAQQFKSNDFKKGDPIVVKFIGEKLTGAKTYTTDKMIALYSQPKKHELINKALYPKFYEENGRQKTYKWPVQQKIEQSIKAIYTPIKVYPNPILQISDEIVVNNSTQTTHLKNARMKLFDGSLQAKEIKWDQKNGLITATSAVFKMANGSTNHADVMTFNLKTGAYAASKPKVIENSEAFQLLKKLARENSSLRATTLLDIELLVSGEIKLNIDQYTINAKIMMANSGSNILSASLASIENADGKIVKAGRIDFDLTTKSYTVQTANFGQAH